MPLRQASGSTRFSYRGIFIVTIYCLSFSVQAASSTDIETATVTAETGNPTTAGPEPTEADVRPERLTTDGYWGFDIGAGFANVSISNDSENEFNNEDGFSLMARLFREQPIHRNLSLHAGLNAFMAIDIGVLSSSSVSSAAYADVGVSLGRPQAPGGVYLSLSAGYGVLNIGDQNNAEGECSSFALFCDDRRGGRASGDVFRVALGKLNRQKTRMQISYTRIKGTSDDFPAGSEASIAVWHLTLGRHF